MIKIHNACGGTGCPKCRDGFIDVPFVPYDVTPVSLPSILPGKEKIAGLLARSTCLEDLTKLLTDECGEKFAKEFAVDLWKNYWRR